MNHSRMRSLVEVKVKVPVYGLISTRMLVQVTLVQCTSPGTVQLAREYNLGNVHPPKQWQCRNVNA
jgi:hypothetical protein